MDNNTNLIKTIDDSVSSFLDKLPLTDKTRRSKGIIMTEEGVIKQVFYEHLFNVSGSLISLKADIYKPGDDSSFDISYLAYLELDRNKINKLKKDPLMMKILNFADKNSFNNNLYSTKKQLLRSFEGENIPKIHNQSIMVSDINFYSPDMSNNFYLSFVKKAIIPQSLKEQAKFISDTDILIRSYFRRRDENATYLLLSED